MENRKILTERLELIQVKNDMVQPLLNDKEKGLEVLSRNDDYVFGKLDSSLKIQTKKYIESSLDENREFFEMYIKSLSSRYDDFLEEHILESDIYSIYISDAHIGCFGVYKSKMLTQFVIQVSELRHAQSIFIDVLKVFEIKNAFVPTCDELLLSLCLDNHKKINMQAYFFEHSDKLVRPAEFSRELLYQATLEDLPEIISVTGDFIDRHEERIKKGELYVLERMESF